MGQDRRRREADEDSKALDEVIEEAIRKDADALGRLYDELYPCVYRTIWFVLRDRDASERLTQDVLAKALSACESYDPAAPSVKGWLFAAVWDVLNRENKHALPATGYHLPPHFLDEGAASSVEFAGAADTLSVAVRQLPPAWQNIVILRYIAGLSEGEVAYVLGMSGRRVRKTEVQALEEVGFWMLEFRDTGVPEEQR